MFSRCGEKRGHNNGEFCPSIEGETDRNFYCPLFVLAQKKQVPVLVFFLKCDFSKFHLQKLDFSQSVLFCQPRGCALGPRKDVAIGGDPKFREMSHFLTSHTHQDGRVEVEGICCDGLVLS